MRMLMSYLQPAWLHSSPLHGSIALQCKIWPCSCCGMGYDMKQSMYTKQVLSVTGSADMCGHINLIVYMGTPVCMYMVILKWT